MPGQRLDGWAVAALVLGVLPIFGIGAVGAVVFGFVSLARQNRDPALRGRAVALAGIVLGLIWVALMVGFAIAYTFFLDPASG